MIDKTEIKNTTGLVWFGNDLRIHDNNVLSLAVKNHTKVIGVFIIDPFLFEENKFGFKKMIIANEVLDPMAIAAIAKINKLKQAEIIFYVDSILALEIIQKHTPSEGEQNLFIEIGTENGRGGVRDLAQVEQIAQQIRADSRLKLRGVTGFEGAVPDAARGRRGEKKISKFCQKIVAAAELAYQNEAVIADFVLPLPLPSMLLDTRFIEARLLLGALILSRRPMNLT